MDKKLKKELQSIIDNTIERENLQGRSFTYGLAFYEYTKKTCNYSAKLYDCLLDYFYTYYIDIVKACEKHNITLDLDDWVELLNTSTLDDIVTDLLNN